MQFKGERAKVLRKCDFEVCGRSLGTQAALVDACVPEFRQITSNKAEHHALIFLPHRLFFFSPLAFAPLSASLADGAATAFFHPTVTILFSSSLSLLCWSMLLTAFVCALLGAASAQQTNFEVCPTRPPVTTTGNFGGGNNETDVTLPELTFPPPPPTDFCVDNAISNIDCDPGSLSDYAIVLEPAGLRLRCDNSNPALDPCVWFWDPTAQEAWLVGDMVLDPLPHPTTPAIHRVSFWFGDVPFAGFPSGSPVTFLNDTCYAVDQPNDWTFFQFWKGSIRPYPLQASSCTISVARTGPSAQWGIGANNQDSDKEGVWGAFDWVSSCPDYGSALPGFPVSFGWGFVNVEFTTGCTTNDTTVPQATPAYPANPVQPLPGSLFAVTDKFQCAQKLPVRDCQSEPDWGTPNAPPGICANLRDTLHTSFEQLFVVDGTPAFGIVYNFDTERTLGDRFDVAINYGEPTLFEVYDFTSPTPLIPVQQNRAIWWYSSTGGPNWSVGNYFSLDDGVWGTHLGPEIDGDSTFNDFCLDDFPNGAWGHENCHATDSWCARLWINGTETFPNELKTYAFLDARPSSFLTTLLENTDADLEANAALLQATPGPTPLSACLPSDPLATFAEVELVTAPGTSGFTTGVPDELRIVVDIPTKYENVTLNVSLPATQIQETLVGAAPCYQRYAVRTPFSAFRQSGEYERLDEPARVCFRGTIRGDMEEWIDQPRLGPISRDLRFEIPFVVCFPKTVATTASDLQVFYCVNDISALLFQGIEVNVTELTDVNARVIIATEVQYPFKLTLPLVSTLVPGIAGNLGISQIEDCSPLPNGVPCFQRWAIDIAPDVTQTCELDGKYTLQFTSVCDAGFPGFPGSCPLNPGFDDYVEIEFRLDSEHFCAQAVEDVGATATLQAFKDPAHTVELPNFILDETAYFVVTASSSQVSIDSVTMEEASVTVDGNPPIVGISGGLPTGLVPGMIISPGVTPANEAWFEWPLVQPFFNVPVDGSLEFTVDATARVVFVGVSGALLEKKEHFHVRLMQTGDGEMGWQSSKVTGQFSVGTLVEGGPDPTDAVGGDDKDDAGAGSHLATMSSVALVVGGALLM
jgi:hypothetical protein